MNLDNLLRGAKEHGLGFGLLILDIDFFKKVNDNHGHNVGDSVLKMAAKTIADSLRALDIPCRWGGEEFIVLLPNVDASVLGTIAERLRMLIEHSWIVEKEKIIKITVSIGGSLSSPDDDISSVVERADSELYKSKENGRNQVNICSLVAESYD